MAAVYRLKGEVVLWPGMQGAWHFVHVDKANSAKIRKAHGASKRGFGAVKVKATIGETSWTTSIFPDSKSGSYALPLKASVRRAESLAAGDPVAFTLTLA